MDNKLEVTKLNENLQTLNRLVSEQQATNTGVSKDIAYMRETMNDLKVKDIEQDNRLFKLEGFGSHIKTVGKHEEYYKIPDKNKRHIPKES